MSDDDNGRPVGARWWRESLATSQLLGSRVVTGIGLLGGAAVGLTGCYDDYVVRDQGHAAEGRDEVESQMDALALQRQQGWNVGQTEEPLQLSAPVDVDVADSKSWQDMETLATALQPAQAQLMPYYVPTLFQSVMGPESSGLREVMQPVHSSEMDRAFARGRALMSLFADAEWPTDTAIVIDVPGAEAVALGAALADRFDPVFTFANWPHPLGVVPSHETLAAALFYRPLFERARHDRPQPAPPVFVLDSNRLNPYGDADLQFDNRYLARMPTTDALKRLGVHHLLYITEGAEQPVELDDLNGEFVALGSEGVDVKMLALSDFQESEDPPPDDLRDTWSVWLSFGTGFYYYGGDPYSHVCFWDRYGWHHRGKGAVLVGPPTVTRVSDGYRYHPQARATIFAPGPNPPAGFRSAYRPSGFGRVAVRTARADGHVTGVRAGRSGSYGGGGGGGGGGSGRSGSFGRFHGGGVGS